MIYKVKIEGVTPYMQHRMDDLKLEEWEKNRKQIIEAARREYRGFKKSRIPLLSGRPW